MLHTLVSSRSLARSFALPLSLLALACTPGPGGSSEDGSSTGTTAHGDETTSVGMTSLASSTSSPPITAGEDDSSTGAAEPMTYVGTWSTGFGFSYFRACGETEEWFAMGLPGYELCEEDALWLRVTGVLLPPEEGSPTPVLQVMEIHEGPCTEGSCDGSVAIGGECGTFEELCEEVVEFECDLLTQDCPIGEKCTPWSYDGGMAWNGTRCSPVVAMPGAPGDPCTVEGSPWSGLDDCAGGSMCWDADPRTGMGECVAQCDQALMPDPACPMGTSCMPIFTRVDPPSTAGVCLPE